MSRQGVSGEDEAAADSRGSLALELAIELREIREILARLERLLEQIALAMGINPHG